MDWHTPAAVVELARRALDGLIELDPCAGPRTRIGVRNIRPPRDGLIRRWAPARCYVNPPYGRALPLWAAKAASEAAAGAEIVLLAPSRTDTRWFRALWSAASAVCFVRGRLRFVGAPASAPFPSAVFYCGPAPARFARVFGELGIVITGCGQSGRHPAQSKTRKGSSRPPPPSECEKKVSNEKRGRRFKQ
jgi:hypothetical protein